MKAEQVSIFLENKAGRLAEVTRILFEARINIRALAVADTSDFGVLRLIVSDTGKAEAVLKNQGFTVSRTEVAAVEVPDEPGGLYRILSIIEENNINIEYMYTFAKQKGENPIMIFRFEEIASAVSILTENGIRIISGEVLYRL